MKNLILLTAMAAVCHVAFTQVPVITSFTPVSGPIGAQVTIAGTNFSATPADNTVYFGAVKADVQSASSTSLTVIVPAGATYQPISVTVNNLIAYTVNPFTVTRTTGGDLDFTTVSFTAPVNLAGDDNITAADIDGDHRIDLICGYGSNKITVFRNTTVGGNISFTPVDLGGSYYLPMSTKAGDLNGDGLLDLVAVGPSDNVLYILKNTSTPGNISFNSPFTIVTGASPRRVAIRDLDNDGKADIACSHSSTTSLAVFKNTSASGNINFAAKADFPVMGSLEGIAIGDLNGDGKPDIVGSYVWSSRLFVYENTSTTGSISFTARPETFYTFSPPSTVAIADIDGDGWADMMSSNSDYFNKNTVGIWRNKGTTPLAFYDSRELPLPIGGEMELSDLDGDGRPDIVSASRFDAATHTISVLKNVSYPGTILFAPAVTYAANGTNTVTVADLDNDGFADIATGDFKTSNLSVFKNQLVTTPCVAVPNAYNITALGSTSFCGPDSAELNTNANVDVQWFWNDQLITEERGSLYIRARKEGAYTMRSLNGACYSAPSNTITVTMFPLPAKPVLSQINDTTFCENGSVNFVSTINNNNQWFKNNTPINNATGVSYDATTTGDYFVKVTNTSSGCANYSDTVSIVVLPAPATPMAIVSGNLTFCIGDSVRLQSTAAGGNQWYLGGTAISNATNQQFLAKTAGIYTVKTTDANLCTSAASAGITVITNPLPAKPVITSGGTSLSTTAGFASYVWYLNNIIIAGATSNQYSTTQNGIYKVTVSDVNGCKNTSDDFNYVTTGLNDVYFPGYTIQLYPNPVINELNVQVEQTLSVNGSITIAVTDVTGKQIHSQILKQGNNTVYFKNLSPGIYMVRLKNGRAEKTIRILKAL